MGAVRNTLRPWHGTPARQCWRTRQSDHLMGRETVALDCWEHSEPSPLRPLRANHGRARLTRFCRPRRPRRQGSHERATMAACRAPQKRRLTCNSSAGSTKTPWRRLILICRRIGPAYSPGVSGIRKSATTRRASGYTAHFPSVQGRLGVAQGAVAAQVGPGPGRAHARLVRAPI
jgi:hypothetical protein